MSRFQELRGVTVIPGQGQDVVDDATVVLDDGGRVVSIRAGTVPGRFVLMPPAVDVHLDVLNHRRRPRATVDLDPAHVVRWLDSELVTAGIGTVCFAAKFEDAPQKGERLEQAVQLCRTIDRIAPELLCDWRIHARVEVTDDGATAALAEALAATGRIVLVSLMEHTLEQSRFATPEAHRAFYAEDWGLSLEAVDAILTRKREGAARAGERRRETAALARRYGAALASHDDRTSAQVRAAHSLGATIAEFPLTLEAAQAAKELGMWTVLGAPNALRGRSTSPGNLAVAEAAAVGVCDILCSDYLPGVLVASPFRLVGAGLITVPEAVAMLSDTPTRALGLPGMGIVEGQPLNAVLYEWLDDLPTVAGLWRNGKLRSGRGLLWERILAPCE